MPSPTSTTSPTTTPTSASEPDLPALIEQIKQLASHAKTLLPDITREQVEEWSRLTPVQRRMRCLDSWREYVLTACVWLGTTKSSQARAQALYIVLHWPVALRPGQEKG